MKHDEPIATIMQTNVLTVHTGNRLSEVRKILIDQKIHHIPVVEEGKLIGLLTSNDLLRQSYGDPYKQNIQQIDEWLDMINLRDAMQEDIVTIKPHESIREAGERLANGLYHCLPVVDEDEKLVGLITTTDLIRYFLDQP